MNGAKRLLVLAAIAVGAFAITVLLAQLLFSAYGRLS